jgi:hypothetical protein
MHVSQNILFQATIKVSQGPFSIGREKTYSLTSLHSGASDADMFVALCCVIFAFCVADRFFYVQGCVGFVGGIFQRFKLTCCVEFGRLFLVMV